jgi:hypothetical protein
VTDGVVFLFIGGAHQVFHLAPVAAELSHRRPVLCLSSEPATTLALRRVAEVLQTPGLRIEEVRPPLWGRLLSSLRGRRSALKRPLLLSLAWRLRRAAAVVTPERTSAVLRRMGLRRARMIHFRHGAGDRAPQSERRLAAFDLVVVPGPKDLRRALERAYLPPEKLRACGYVKLELCARMVQTAPRLFNNHRPTVLYNPHFDPAISSWSLAEEVLALFRDQSRYNLVFAPHIRAAENLDAAARLRWQGLAREGSIIVDLDSPRLLDMTYTLGADIYLGDMSSQLYEFLVRPRPVAFLNAHGAAWRSDPRFAGWALGEVADSVPALLDAIDRAVAGHAAMAARQQDAVRDAFGPIEGAAARGAMAIEALLLPEAAPRA